MPDKETERKSRKTMKWVIDNHADGTHPEGTSVEDLAISVINDYNRDKEAMVSAGKKSGEARRDNAKSEWDKIITIANQLIAIDTPKYSLISIILKRTSYKRSQVRHILKDAGII